MRKERAAAMTTGNSSECDYGISACSGGPVESSTWLPFPSASTPAKAEETCRKSPSCSDCLQRAHASERSLADDMLRPRRVPNWLWQYPSVHRWCRSDISSCACPVLACLSDLPVFSCSQLFAAASAEFVLASTVACLGVIAVRSNTRSSETFSASYGEPFIPH